MDDVVDWFEEPKDFRPPPPLPRDFSVTRPEPFAPLQIQLVGHHSLWAHELWNAGVVMGQMLEKDPSICKGKNVLELGGGASVPSLISALLGAKTTVATDYPDSDLIGTIRSNVDRNVPAPMREHVHVKGHLWGNDVTDLLSLLPEGEKFDLIFLSDLVFNHGQHTHLLESCQRCLRSDGQGRAFITLAQSPPFNYHVERLDDVIMPVMFPNDPGSAEVRSTVQRYVFS